MQNQRLADLQAELDSLDRARGAVIASAFLETLKTHQHLHFLDIVVSNREGVGQFLADLVGNPAAFPPDFTWESFVSPDSGFAAEYASMLQVSALIPSVLTAVEHATVVTALYFLSADQFEALPYLRNLQGVTPQEVVRALASVFTQPQAQRAPFYERLRKDISAMPSSEDQVSVSLLHIDGKGVSLVLSISFFAVFDFCQQKASRYFYDSLDIWLSKPSWIQGFCRAKNHFSWPQAAALQPDFWQKHSENEELKNAKLRQKVYQ